MERLKFLGQRKLLSFAVLLAGESGLLGRKTRWPGGGLSLVSY